MHVITGNTARKRVTGKQPARHEPEAEPLAAATRFLPRSRARFCLICQRVKLDGPRHKSDTGHAYRPLTVEEKGALAHQVPAAGRDNDGLYRFAFGKHKKRTIQEVFAKDPAYFT
eukprot:13257197-Alexandrium_andersonii.AAC.1